MNRTARAVLAALTASTAYQFAYSAHVGAYVKKLEKEGFDVKFNLPLIGEFKAHFNLPSSSGSGDSPVVYPADAVAIRKRAWWVSLMIAAASAGAVYALAGPGAADEDDDDEDEDEDDDT